MKWQRVFAGFLLLLALGAIAPAQPKSDKPSGSLDDILGKVGEWERHRSDAIAKEWKAAKERMEPFWQMLEAEQLRADNKFAEALAKAETAAQPWDGKPTERLRDDELIPCREALLALARLRAVMGEQEEAAKLATRAEEVHKRVRPRNPKEAADATLAALAIALVYVASDQPARAVPLVDRVRDDCRNLTSPHNEPASNSLLVQALVLKCHLANTYGNSPQALADGTEALNYPASLTDSLHVMALTNVALARMTLGDTGAVRGLLKEADDILSKVGSRGKAMRATVNLIRGRYYLQIGEVGPAVDVLSQVRQSYEELFPKAQFPRSHPTLIYALIALADLWNQSGQRPDQAVANARLAWEHCQDYCGEKAYELKVLTLLCYGRCLRDDGQIPAARQRFSDALAVAQQLGQEQLIALCQLQLGSLLARLDQPEEARRLLGASLATFRRLPDGHPHLLATAVYLGTLALKQDDREEARNSFAAALASDRQQLRRLFRAAAAVDELAFTQPRQLALNGYLSASRDVPGLEEQAYAWVWSAKQANTRLAEAHLTALRLAAAKAPRVRQLLTDLADNQARVGQALTECRGGSSLQALRDEMDRLEKELDAAMAKSEGKVAHDAPEDSGARDLAAALPQGSAFIDLVRYDDLANQTTMTARYVAFVALPGQAPLRVELGMTQEIDRAVKSWRESVEQWDATAPEEVQLSQEKKTDEAAQRLRQLVWDPMAAPLKSTTLLYIAPDGDLARFPFAALPGPSGTVLLEQFTIAYVPHGAFLLERLRSRGKAAPPRTGKVLALGDVAYGPVGDPSPRYASLPGSRRMLDELARTGAAGPHLRVLEGEKATVAALRQELPEAEEALISTHCFLHAEELAADRQRLAQALREWSPRFDKPLGHLGLGRRYPLSFIGIALAGANAPEQAGPEGGVLTGEAIPRLSLGRLRYVFLDGCETGLGEYTAGEGVQSYQRAFHLAECPNVIATLWAVDDGVAPALTKAFGLYLRKKKLPTLEALRQTQLTLYKHPELIRVSGTRRGIGKGASSGGPIIALPNHTGQRQRSPAALWAAYVHSGVGDPMLTPAELAALDTHMPLDVLTTPQPSPGGPEETRRLLWWGLGAMLILAGVGAAYLAARKSTPSTERPETYPGDAPR